jgi:integrase
MVDEERALEWVWPSATSASGHIEESKEVSRWKRKDGSVVIKRKVDKSPHALRASWRTIAGDLGIDSDHRHAIMNHALPRGAHNDYASPEEWTKLVDSMEKVSSAIVDAIGSGKL